MRPCLRTLYARCEEVACHKAFLGWKAGAEAKTQNYPLLNELRDRASLTADRCG